MGDINYMMLVLFNQKPNNVLVDWYRTFTKKFVKKIYLYTQRKYRRGQYAAVDCYRLLINYIEEDAIFSLI